MADGETPDEPAEAMRYQMLGEDTSSLEDKLAKYAGRARWEDLKAHLASRTLVYVDPALDLATVGQAFARDAKDQVDEWIKKGDLVIPSEPHGAYWESINALFDCQVVSPFVLIQPVDDADPGESS